VLRKPKAAAVVAAARYNSAMPGKKPVNPFYVALLPVGVVFAVTACAYGVMTLHELDPRRTNPSELIALMDRHGLVLMVVELALLGVLTVAAIASDDFWMRSADTPHRQPTDREDAR
jgi:hypothetical protein